MSSQNDIGFKSFVASGAISAYTVVNVQTDGTIKASANNVKGVGILQEDAADGNYASVKLFSAPGTFLVAVSGSATTSATTYEVITGGFAGAGAGTGTAVFRALSTSVSSNGRVIEFTLA
jgi:hypothetical protein